jgi:hypothetical protein
MKSEDQILRFNAAEREILSPFFAQEGLGQPPVHPRRLKRFPAENELKQVFGDPNKNGPSTYLEWPQGFSSGLSLRAYFADGQLQELARVKGRVQEAAGLSSSDWSYYLCIDKADKRIVNSAIETDRTRRTFAQSLASEDMRHDLVARTNDLYSNHAMRLVGSA